MQISTNFPFVKQHGVSFTVAMVYLISRVSNEITEFRYRILDGEVVEHDIVHRDFTILVDDDVLSFCTIDYVEDFAGFAEIAAQGIADVQEHLTLGDEPGKDDLLFMTALPWMSFASFKAPMRSHPGDSIPLHAWSKFFQDGDSLEMSLCLEIHHALIDGAHVGKLLTMVKDYLQKPEVLLGEVWRVGITQPLGKFAIVDYLNQAT